MPQIYREDQLLKDEEHDGYEAARNKRDIDVNPYMPNTAQWEAWRRGFENYHHDKADEYYSKKYCF